MSSSWAMCAGSVRARFSGLVSPSLLLFASSAPTWVSFFALVVFLLNLRLLGADPPLVPLATGVKVFSLVVDRATLLTGVADGSATLALAPLCPFSPLLFVLVGENHSSSAR